MQLNSNMETTLTSINTLESILIKELTKNFSTVKSGGLYSGKSGIVLALLHYAANNNLDSNIRTYIEELSIKTFAGLMNYSEGFTFSAGISGTLWALHNLQKNELVELDDTIFEEHAKAINLAMLQFAEQNYFDNLHGAFGVLNYLVETNTLAPKIFHQLIQLYKEKIYTDEVLTLAKEKYVVELDQKAYNFSLSHGLSGKILILTRLHKKYPQLGAKPLLDDLIEKTLELSKISSIDTPIFFPSLLENLSDNIGSNSRMAWCYGDIGPSLAVYKYAQAFEREELLGTITGILEKLSAKRNRLTCGIKDAPLCHGVSGLTYIYSKLYHETGLTSFKDAADYWENSILKFYTKNLSLKELGSFSPSQNEFTYNLSLLEGLAGILLCIHSKKNQLYNWDNSLLIN